MQRQHYSVTVSVLPFFLDHLPEMLMMIFFFFFLHNTHLPNSTREYAETIKPQGSQL